MEVYAKIAQGGNLQNLVWTKVNNDKRVNSKYFESYHLNILTIYIMHIQKKSLFKLSIFTKEYTTMRQKKIVKIRDIWYVLMIFSN